MPPAARTARRWASRRPRPLRKRGKKQASRQPSKHAVPRKPRLVRRYKRPPKHPDSVSSTSTLGGGSKTKSGVPKLVGAEQHNDVVADRKTTSRAAVNAEVTAVPNPTPDAGLTPPPATPAPTSSAIAAGSPLFGGATFDTVTSGLSVVNPTSVAPVTTSTTPVRTATISFSPLPPLQSFAPSSLSSVGVRPAAVPTTSGPSEFASPTPVSGDSTSRQISVALVILVSVGSALLLLGFCIVVKMCTRRRKPPRPTPSLPLKGGDADEDYYETKESPIFGGHERMSAAMAANGPIWNWVQYPHTKLSGPTAPPVHYDCPSQQTQQNYGLQNQVYPAEQAAYPESRFNLATRGPSSPPGVTVSQEPETPAGRPILQNVAATPGMKRMSRQSLSFYASSNMEAPMPNVREETVLTGDGNDVIKRSRAKTASRRFSQPGLEDRRQRNSTVSFVGLPYDEEGVMSPAPVEYGHVIQDTPVMNGDFAGRARVKSGYFATGTYPRMSTLPNASYSIATATRINVGQRNSFSKDKMPLQKGNSKRRTRDTQALTYALGLATPRTEYAGTSPQPTLYPDDSVSVMDGRRLKKSGKAMEAVPEVPVMVPMNSAGQGGSTDTLMGMDFGVSQMSLSGLALGAVSEGDEDREAERSVSSSSSSRSVQQVSASRDKAPRVPSPPPLPSLAQMGLARNNPEGYDSYRSPTYSLYGLYQTADRKSYVGR